MISYGGRYNTMAQTLGLAVNSPRMLPLPDLMPAENVTFNLPDSLTIEEPGIYEINYMFNASSSLGAAVTLSVRNNGVIIPSTEETHILAIGVESIYSGSVLETLSAGDVLTVEVESSLELTLTLSSGVTATLSVKKLDTIPTVSS